MRAFYKSRTVQIWKDGELFGEYPNYQQAAKAIEIGPGTAKRKAISGGCIYGYCLNLKYETLEEEPHNQVYTKRVSRWGTIYYYSKNRKPRVKKLNPKPSGRPAKKILVYKDGELYGEYPSMVACGKDLGVKFQNIWKILNGYKSTLKGFEFKRGES